MWLPSTPFIVPVSDASTASDMPISWGYFEGRFKGKSLSEAIELIIKGKKVRCHYWPKDEYVFLHKTGGFLVIIRSGKKHRWSITEVDIHSEWELLESNQSNQ